MTRSKPSILIAEDNVLLRECLRELIEDDLGLDVVGEAANGEEAIALTKKHRPDLVLMDLELPVISGFEATETIVESVPESAIIAISMHHDSSVQRRALEAGAAVFVVKDGPEEELLETIMRVHDEASRGSQSG